MTKRKVSTKPKGTKDKPVSAEIRRAAERAGIPLLPAGDESALGRARDQIAAALAPDLVRACDSLGEELASIEQLGGGDNSNVIDALSYLWRVRAELGILQDGITWDEQAKQAAGGAS
jgi:hypothetical protein